MEERELTEEMLNYLNEIRHYWNFIEWMKERGYSEEEVTKATDKIEGL